MNKGIKEEVNKMRRLLKQPLLCEYDTEDYYEKLLNAENSIIYDFFQDKQNGITQKRWRLIKPTQYKKALMEFMQFGKLMRFPTSVIDDWIDIILTNTAELSTITDLVGHSNDFDFYTYCDILDLDVDEYGSWEKIFDYLDELGFYDWAELPDGSDAWSDYGLRPIEELIQKLLTEDKTYEERLVTINRIMDVYHQRGDLSSMFIEGGSKTLSAISNGLDVMAERIKIKKNML